MTDELILDHRSKSYPLGAAPCRAADIGTKGWNLLADDLPYPLAAIRRSALAHNIAWMQDFATRKGVALAPHGKTTMSPQLLQGQLKAGAWGLTFATVGQARVGVAAGASRIVIANQVVQQADLAGIAALHAQAPGLRVIFLLDSLAQLALIEASQPARPFEVLLELGLAGGRTGCRSEQQALDLARRAHASSAVRLVGIECYEGLAATGDDAADREHAASLMARVAAITRQCEQEDLFEADDVIVSAGGSAIFDLVVPGLKPALSRKVLGLLRSGCYVTHDDGFYKRMVSAVNRRLGCTESSGLQPALEVWAAVQSLPEAGLAILTVGKRDISYDLGMPIPLAVSPLGTREVQLAPAAWSVSGMNDQHAYLRLGDAQSDLKLGDRVALGISHPCTTFDKWRWMPVVDEHYDVVDAIVTYF